MTNKRIAQTNQQQKSEKSQESGILQRAAVRSVSDAGVQSTDDREAQPLSNSAFSKDFSRVPISTTKPQQIMAKLMIGAVGDKYEQEADRVAAQVVQRINAPASMQSGEDETVQREMETNDNEARLMRSPILQRRSTDGGMAATPDLEASINRAKSSGQPIANNIREPMEKAFGADFSGVKVHTDAQSDQLNRSIQSRAFTTGQDVFFRQGEYTPGSEGGQELLAHELTHVVQQSKGAVQRQLKEQSVQTTNMEKVDNLIQRAIGFEFEIGDVTTYRKGSFGGEVNLPKKDEILIGEGFKVEADEMPRHSNMEFVTDAFPETGEGVRKLGTALDRITGIINQLSNRRGIEIPSYDLNEFGTPINNRFMKPTANLLTGKPQVTAGIRLNALDKFFSDVEFQDTAGNAENANNDARVMFGGQLIAGGSGARDAVTQVGVQPVSQARAAVNEALKEINNPTPTEDSQPQLPQLPVIDGSELRALVTQLVIYLVNGLKGVPGYGKTIAGEFMSRTDFAKVYKLLPQTQLDFFNQHPEMFVEVVYRAADKAAMRSGYRERMTIHGPVFEGGLYNDPGMFGQDPNYKKNLLPQLKRYDWLMGIVKGEDLLTEVNYPGNKKQKAEIESLGSYGSKVDELSQNPAVRTTPAPLVEFRGLKPLFANLITPFALDMFRYVHTINTQGLEQYPGELLSLNQDDRLNLIYNQNNAQNIRNRLVREALNHIRGK